MTFGDGERPVSGPGVDEETRRPDNNFGGWPSDADNTAAASIDDGATGNWRSAPPYAIDGDDGEFRVKTNPNEGPDEDWGDNDSDEATPVPIGEDTADLDLDLDLDLDSDHDSDPVAAPAPGTGPARFPEPPVRSPLTQRERARIRARLVREAVRQKKAEVIVAGYRWLYKVEGDAVVPRKGIVRAVALTALAAAGTYTSLHYGSEIGHVGQGLLQDAQNMFHHQTAITGGTHAIVGDIVNSTVATTPASAPKVLPTTTGIKPPTSAPNALPASPPKPPTGSGVGAPKPPKGSTPPAVPAPAAPSPSTETVTIGAHGKNDVWQELHAQDPKLTKHQIANMINYTEHATGHDLDHVKPGQKITLLAPPQSPTPATPVHHAAQLQAHTLQGGKVAPIQQPEGSSVFLLQPDAAHNSVGDVALQVLKASDIPAKAGQLPKLVNDLELYNHLAGVNEHTLPINWPVYVPPEAVLRHLLEEAMQTASTQKPK